MLTTPLGKLLVQRLVDSVGLTGIPSLSEAFIARAAIRCGLDLSPWSAVREELMTRLTADQGRLPQAADLLVSSKAADRWWSNLNRVQQVWVGRSATGPNEDDFKVDTAPFRPGITKPRTAFWTCTYADGIGSGWIEWLRWGDDQRPGPYHPWRVSAPDSSRVAEIHSAKDWHGFVETCPARKGHRGLLVPDWSLASRQWDAVHLSMGGFLTAQGVEYSAGGTTTKLNGWGFESTVWLRWVFAEVAELPLEPN